MICPLVNLVESTGADRLKSRNNVGPKRESSVPKDATDASISAHTFTFRELQAATKNFRDECFIGEGGFGRVYKGQLENGQVEFLSMSSSCLTVHKLCLLSCSQLLLQF